MSAKLIGLTGFAGSGKSTIAKGLEADYQMVRQRFAGPIKDMLRAYLGYYGLDYAEIDRMVDGDLKNVPSDALAGRTPRYALQTLGTEWGRNLMGENFWIDAVMRSAELALEWGDDVVIDDVRFQNEVEAIKERDGTVIAIHRDGAGIGLGHASEAHIGDLEVDFVVDNNGRIGDAINIAALAAFGNLTDTFHTGEHMSNEADNTFVEADLTEPAPAPQPAPPPPSNPSAVMDAVGRLEDMAGVARGMRQPLGFALVVDSIPAPDGTLSVSATSSLTRKDVEELVRDFFDRSEQGLTLHVSA